LTILFLTEEAFTSQVITFVLTCPSMFILILLVFRSAHPSPLSAHKGFLGNGHFKKANEWLSMKYGKDAEINWTVLAAK
jgi:hypothetical protein